MKNNTKNICTSCITRKHLPTALPASAHSMASQPFFLCKYPPNPSPLGSSFNLLHPSTSPVQNKTGHLLSFLLRWTREPITFSHTDCPPSSGSLPQPCIAFPPPLNPFLGWLPQANLLSSQSLVLVPSLEDSI